MRNFIIILFALGLIGCVGCSETEPALHNHCGIPSSSQSGFVINSPTSNDGWDIICSLSQEDLDPTDLCSDRYSLCEYYSCLTSYSAIVARMNVCSVSHLTGDAGMTDAGMTDAGTTDTGMNTADVFGGDVETNTEDDATDDTGTDTFADATDDVPTDTEDAEAQDAGEYPQVEWCNRMNEELPPETDPQVIEDRNILIDEFCEEYIRDGWDGEFFDECDDLCGLR